MINTFISVLAALVVNEMIKSNIPIWYKIAKGFIVNEYKKFRTRKQRKLDAEKAEAIKQEINK